MGALFINLLTLVLLLVSAFIVLIVLMQRTSQSGGMGAALGGGAAESAFGSETNNVLMRGTIYGIVSFFVVALALYLLYQARVADRVEEIVMPTLVTSPGSGDADETGTEVSEAISMEAGAADVVVEEAEAIQAEVGEAVESAATPAPEEGPAGK